MPIWFIFLSSLSQSSSLTSEQRLIICCKWKNKLTSQNWNYSKLRRLCTIINKKITKQIDRSFTMARDKTATIMKRKDWNSFTHQPSFLTAFKISSKLLTRPPLHSTALQGSSTIGWPTREGRKSSCARHTPAVSTNTTCAYLWWDCTEETATQN